MAEESKPLDNMAKGRIAKLQKDLLEIGFTAPEEWDEATLRKELKERKEAVQAVKDSEERLAKAPGDAAYAELLLMVRTIQEDNQMLRKRLDAIGDDAARKQGIINPDLLDPKDLLEKPVSYWCQQVAHSWDHKMVNGHVYPIPGGRPVEFKERMALPVVVDGKVVDHRYVCTLTVTSKRLHEFIEGKDKTGVPHQELGYTVWHNSSEAITADTQLQQIVMEKVRALENMDEIEILQMCKQNNIETNMARSKFEYIHPLAKIYAQFELDQLRKTGRTMNALKEAALA